MRCTARVEIHDNEYSLLHELMEAASFSRTAVDSSTGKKVHMPNASYATDAYATPRAALLAAIGAALRVDMRAEIVVSGGDQILTYGCREVEENSFGNIIALMAQSTVPVPSGGFYDFFRNQPEKGSAFGTVPVSESAHSPFWEALLKA